MSSSEKKAINDLADEDLANIFNQLPPYERLLVSQINKRWYELSRIPWRDVRHLDLTPIPGENISSIVKQCPNLRTVFAKDKNFKLSQLNILTRAHLSSLKLYRCSSVIPEVEAENVPLLSVFSDNLPNASWKELVLCGADFVINREPANNYVLGALPNSLERLQLNDFNVVLPSHGSVMCKHDGDVFTSCLRPLHQLTCLILCASSNETGIMSDWGLLPGLRMNNLRELCVDFGEWGWDCTFETLAVDLPRLEILFLNNATYMSDNEMEQLAAKHPALHILCITGSFGEEFIIPERRLFPNVFGSDPVPKLHVFVGKEPSEKITFTKSPANALEIHPITDPLPVFLEKKETAPLFEGVWIAAQIKEGAKHGSDWWKYEGDIATSFRTANDA